MMATDPSSRLPAQSARHVLRGDSDEIDFIDDAYTKAVSEWNQIEPLPILCISPDLPDAVGEECVTERNRSASNDTPISRDPKACRHSDLEAIFDFIMTVDVTTELRLIVSHAERNMILKLAGKIFFLGSKSMNRNLKHERNRIFALALKPFDNNEPVHQKMLTCIYQHLRREEGLNCPRIGSHWEEIGFQGIDPASDLRGVGILGLFQLAFFVLAPETAPLAHDVYALSTRKGSDFPFSVMGLNLTQIALHHLRQGTLNREINRRQSPLLTCNFFYASLFMRLFHLWKQGNCTVADTGFVLRDLNKSSGKAVRISILTALTYTSSADESNSNSGLIVFSDIGNIVDPDSKEREDGDENLV